MKKQNRSNPPVNILALGHANHSPSRSHQRARVSRRRGVAIETRETRGDDVVLFAFFLFGRIELVFAGTEQPLAVFVSQSDNTS
jgi:hypothetical protein